jgi:hypothetical protein
VQIAELAAGIRDRTDRPFGLNLSLFGAALAAALLLGAQGALFGTRFLAATKTVERHLSNLYRELGVSNRTEAVTAAIQSIADSRDVSWRWDVERKH